MMRTLLIISLILALLAITPLASSSAFFGSATTYETVYVQPGDTVWKIAANFVTDKEDIREKIFAIRQLNKLNNNAQVYPGQALKVPVNR